MYKNRANGSLRCACHSLRGVTVIFPIAYVAGIHAQQIGAKDIAGMRNVMDKLVDRTPSQVLNMSHVLRWESLVMLQSPLVLVRRMQFMPLHTQVFLSQTIYFCYSGAMTAWPKLQNKLKKPKPR
eukprot:gnl/MRDRNA2_/MRDRNA2_84572_c0_seq3.p1 gnl/MRDRNA2_/MRDRNA2_84572_c0~~gnl/MRDRNA2_/MRDRNA2_84572_c0_seq3.p1  ORF type:complete len:125 (-),score=8.04 gnl/MRDRNA2_/MRDRNA2_84572_c0_seq3:60-434(-)